MNESQSKTRYFLFELVINCLIFAISAAVCLNLFAYGFIQNQDSRELSMATLEAQSVAETIKATGGETGLLSEYLQCDASAEGLTLYYDRDWQRTSSAQGALYTLNVRFAPLDKGVQTANIIVENQTETIYELTIQQYLSQEVLA